MSQEELQSWLEGYARSLERAKRIRAVIPSQLAPTSYMTAAPDAVMAKDPELNPLRILRFADEGKGLLNLLESSPSSDTLSRPMFERFGSAELRASFTLHSGSSSSISTSGGGTKPQQREIRTTTASPPSRGKRKRGIDEDSFSKRARVVPDPVGSPMSGKAKPLASPTPYGINRSPSPAGAPATLSNASRSSSPTVSTNGAAQSPVPPSPANPPPPLPPGPPPPARKPSVANLLGSDSYLTSQGYSDDRDGLLDEAEDFRYSKDEAPRPLQDELMRTITSLIKVSDWPRSVRKVITAMMEGGIPHGNPFVVPPEEICGSVARGRPGLQVVYDRVKTKKYYMSLDHFSFDVRSIVKDATKCLADSTERRPSGMMEVILKHFTKVVDRELQYAHDSLNAIPDE